MPMPPPPDMELERLLASLGIKIPGMPAMTPGFMLPGRRDMPRMLGAPGMGPGMFSSPITGVGIELLQRLFRKKEG